MSDEAVAWVMNHSRAKGAVLLSFLFMANDCNCQGLSIYSSYDHVAARTGQHPRTVRRHFRLLVREGELVRTSVGSGATASVWTIPGVVRDGFYRERRGDKMPPQRGQDAPGRGDKMPPQGGQDAPQKVGSSGSFLNRLNRTRNSNYMPTGGAVEKPVDNNGSCPYELRQILFAPPYHLDPAACDRLWRESREQLASVSQDEFMVIFREVWPTVAALDNPIGGVIRKMPATVRALREVWERKRVIQDPARIKVR